MNEGFVLELGRNALQITLMLTVPMLALSLVIGVVIGVFQAATQIHEQTLIFVPKILAFFLMLALLGPWMLQSMVLFTRNVFINLPNLAK
jgi:flagellar biosynthesis protein FliQ